MTRCIECRATNGNGQHFITTMMSNERRTAMMESCNPPSSSSSSWDPPPLHRHLSTVGIGPVFVCPPLSHYQLPPPPPPPPSLMCDNGPASNGKKEEEPHQPHQQQQVEHASKSASKSSSNKVIKTWEIIGDIKCTPQDFVVREIGWCPPSNHYYSAQDNSEKSNSDGDRSYMNKYTQRKGWRRGIAGLTESVTSTHDDEDEDDNDCREHIIVSSAANEEKEPDIIKGTAVTTEQRTSADIPIAKQINTTPSENDVGAAKTLPIASSSPSLSPAAHSPPPTSEKVLRQILIQCFDSSIEMTLSTASDDYADSIMKQLASLQHTACEQLGGRSTKTAGTADKAPSDEAKGLCKEPLDLDTNTVWISTSNLFKDDTNKGSWKLLHQTLRQVYPLLKTENASHPTLSKEDATSSNEGNKDDENKKKNAWVCTLVDDCFFSLIPYLLHPAEDLFQLYKFRMGPVISATSNEDGSRSNQTNNRKKNRWKKGTKDDHNNSEDRAQKAKESNEGKVLLRLKPEIPRTERRNIHQIITGKNNRKSDFETSTRNDVPINGDDELDNVSAQTTSAIVVQWSNMALQKSSQKKRKRESTNSSITCDNKCKSSKSDSKTSNASPSDINVLFCTLKKEQVEHQVAIQSLMRALKCRPGDIGLAGIKDMKAITYQFCTLRNVDMKRAQRPIMDTRVSLTNFMPVQNFLLDRGRLVGNQFEITLRKLKQVERLEEDEGSSTWKERPVPVRSSHLDAMVNRVATHGFINYYGEQRVGDAGHKEYVGIRSFDVGRALLQSNFSLAVDLIMEGRSTNVYNPTVEEVSSLIILFVSWLQSNTHNTRDSGEYSTDMEGNKRC